MLNRVTPLGSASSRIASTMLGAWLVSFTMRHIQNQARNLEYIKKQEQRVGKSTQAVAPQAAPPCDGQSLAFDYSQLD